MAIKRISDLAAYDPTLGSSAYFIPVDKVGGQTTKMPLSDVLTIHDTTALEDLYPILLTGEAHLERVVRIEDYNADKAEIEQNIAELGLSITQEEEARIAAEQFYAPKANPTLTGLVTVPTRNLNDNTTAAASTEYVMRAISQIDISGVDLSPINTALALKADISYVDTQISTRATLADISSAIVGKVDTSVYTSGIALKADKTYVDNSLALKSDTSSVNTALALKADVSSVNSLLASKADISFVTSSISMKADTSLIDSKADAASTATALAAKADLVNGVVPANQIPLISFNHTFVVNSESEMLSTGAVHGDIVVRTDISRNFVLGGTGVSTILGNWIELAGGTGSGGAVSSVNGMVGSVTITKSDVGLGSVVNADTTNPANIIQSSGYRFVTDAEKSSWNSKAASAHTHAIADISGLETRLTNIESSDTSVSGRVTTLEGVVNTATTNISTNTGDITSLTGRVTATEGSISTIGSRVTSAEASISGLNSRVTAAEGSISTLNTTVSTNTSNISTANANISSINTTVSGIDTRVTALETAGQSSISMIDSGVLSFISSEKKKVATIWDRHSTGTRPHGYVFAFVKNTSNIPVVITIEEHNTPVSEATPTTLIKTHYMSSIINGDTFDSAPFSMLVDYTSANQLFVFVNNTSTSAGTAKVVVGKQDIA